MINRLVDPLGQPPWSNSKSVNQKTLRTSQQTNILISSSETIFPAIVGTEGTMPLDIYFRDGFSFVGQFAMQDFKKLTFNFESAKLEIKHKNESRQK
jgi:hypothetical protein